ncbi:KxYKxGKxW signal peptide domain-containing protein [Paucilactobacillus hokkaidonensis]|nr:KxYKxGKxW signal peptide domain-containing protein [Paucilactobacillus hokkaidonensis]
MKSKKNIQLNAALNTPKSRVKMYKANKIWLFAGALVFMMVGGGSVAYADNATPTSDTPAVTQTTSSSAPSSNIASPASASTELTATPASNSVVAEVNKPASAGSNATSATSSAVVPETKAATSSAATVINQTTKYQTTSGDSIAQSESIDLTNGDYPSFSQPKTVSGYNFDLSNSRFQIVSDGEVAFDGTLSDYAELTNLG